MTYAKLLEIEPFCPELVLNTNTCKHVNLYKEMINIELNYYY